MLVKEAAAQDAEATLSAYWQSGRFPVDPMSIAEAMGISVQEQPLPADTSGLIVKREHQDAEIILSRTDPKLRKVFTCAHELGHYVERTNRGSDKEFGFVDKRTPANNVHEFYANEFAANLLMPASEVHRQARTLDPIRMASYFNVSLPAMRVRLAKLDIQL